MTSDNTFLKSVLKMLKINFRNTESHKNLRKKIPKGEGEALPICINLVTADYRKKKKQTNQTLVLVRQAVTMVPIKGHNVT